MLVHIGLKRKVDSSGRTCIPKDFLDELGVKSNQELEFNLVVLDGEKIITVKKVKSQKKMQQSSIDINAKKEEGE